jgi:hypothetical protein
VSNYNNPRAGEFNMTLNVDDIHRLKPLLFELELQGVVDEKLMDLYAGSNLRYSCTTTQNFIRQKYSLHKVFKIMSYYELNKGIKYDFLIAARPDTMVNSKVFIPEKMNARIAIPNTHQNEGVNDRFAMGSRDSMAIYFNQYTYLKSHEGLHAWTTEMFVCNYLKHKKVSIMIVGVCIIRKRANGIIPEYDKISHPFAQVSYPTCIGFKKHTSAKNHPCLTFWNISKVPKIKISKRIRHLRLQNPQKSQISEKRIEKDRWNWIKQLFKTKAPIIDQDSYQRAHSVCEGYSTVVYTSYADNKYSPDLSKLIKTMYVDICYVVFVGTQPCNAMKSLQWHLICFSSEYGISNMRRMSKIPKLIPHLLFPGKTTVYIDTKLQLIADVHQLINSSLPKLSWNFAAFGHPVPCAHPNCQRVFHWMRREAVLIAMSQRTESTSSLIEQIRNYATNKTVPIRKYNVYIDTGILIQRNAIDLFNMWLNEFLKYDHSDRDQLSFAHIVAAHDFDGNHILPPKPPFCTNYCHWWYSENTALLNRHDQKNSKKSHEKIISRTLSDISCGW